MVLENIVEDVADQVNSEENCPDISPSGDYLVIYTEGKRDHKNEVIIDESDKVIYNTSGIKARMASEDGKICEEFVASPGFFSDIYNKLSEKGNLEGLCSIPSPKGESKTIYIGSKEDFLESGGYLDKQSLARVDMEVVREGINYIKEEVSENLEDVGEDLEHSSLEYCLS